MEGKVVVFAWWLKKDGLSEKAVRSPVECLKTSQKKDARLSEPEPVKGIIALQDDWSKDKGGRRRTHQSWL